MAAHFPVESTDARNWKGHRFRSTDHEIDEPFHGTGSVIVKRISRL
jgi:hypothetical protein